MNTLRNVWRQSWPLVCMLSLFALAAVAGLTINCTHQQAAAEELKTPSPVTTGYTAVTLINDWAENKSLAITVKDIIGVKVDGHSWDSSRESNLHDTTITWLVAVRETNTDGKSRVKMLKFVGQPVQTEVVFDIPATMPAWIEGRVLCGDPKAKCTVGRYTVVGPLTVHLHSLDELH